MLLFNKTNHLSYKILLDELESILLDELESTELEELLESTELEELESTLLELELTVGPPHPSGISS